MRAYDFDLEEHLIAHNRKHRIRRVLYVLASIPLWWLSYWIIRVLVHIPVTLLTGSRTAVKVAAWMMMALLLVEGARKAKEIVSADRYMNSVFLHGLTGTREERTLRFAFARVHGVPDPLAVGFVVSEILFCAPRTVVKAWESHRAIVTATRELREEAQDLFDLLLTERRWVQVEEYRDRAEALGVLDRADLLWNRIKDEVGEIRIPAALTNEILSGDEG